jgi:hypothetical protein
MKKIFNNIVIKSETPVSHFKHAFLIFALSAAMLAGCGKDETPPDVEEPEEVVDNTIEPLTRKIMDGTTVIGTFVSDVTIPISTGVTQTQISFLRKDKLPVKMFILQADMKTPKLELQGMAPYNDWIPSLQKISEMSRDNELPGTNIVAAINGDVFATTGVPSSLFYINNRVYKSTITAGRTYFAALNDGSLVIGGNDTKGVPRPVTLSQIKNAIGGFQWLVDNGVKATLTDVTIIPRTSIGYTADKVIYAIMVDGAQAAYSNGLSLADLRDIFFTLGVKDAINLDGGASTTFVVKDKSKGQWNVQNRPTGILGTERLVANGWAFVVKD